MIRLPNFNIGQRIVDDQGKPTTGFLSYINNTIKAIADAISQLQGAVGTIETTVEQVAVAVATANEAYDASFAGSAEASLVNSYVVGSNVLMATILDPARAPDAAYIYVAAHIRTYGDGKSVALPQSAYIAAGSIATTYYVTYLDPERDGKNITYQITNNLLDAGQGNDRHLVGVVATPAAGSGAVYYGRTTLPPGLRGLTG